MDYVEDDPHSVYVCFIACQTVFGFLAKIVIEIVYGYCHVYLGGTTGSMKSKFSHTSFDVTTAACCSVRGVVLKF